ncbi:MAG: DUF2188 domain-containing protein [Gemmatimonadaceae bacterium]
MSIKAMKSRRNVHVVPTVVAASRRARFVAIVAGTQDPLTEPTSQREAIAAATVEAKRRRSEVVIHRANGRIRDADSYGHDSPQVRDTKH